MGRINLLNDAQIQELRNKFLLS